jgi:hypothetical protein
MTPPQIELARHALGLKQGLRKSYRNHFVAGPHHEDYAEWERMVAQGDATVSRAKKAIFGGDDCFFLTPKGAMAALRRGESLDPEDFP